MTEHANGVIQKISNHIGGLGSFPPNVLFSTDRGNTFKITLKLQNNKLFITVEIPSSQQKYTKKWPDGAPSAEHQATLS
ncbi:hypothetical protein [Corynebacterium pseudotuberculosis]|uniref:hypothetical protein n=1 Tax=Corynebacterium pseudotuberculosis TaxID=1719 RepID=UPI0012DB0863|nr:hypothetical protein [Corynebacterium pseudotuberculosis]QGX02903.1 hypothetical protein CP162_02140 [Corynebacterium pseudotuberculosis Cp162]WFP67589.1 hypothetical protein P8128_02125 [Corynebacterium pseudotuberculosis]